MSNFWQRLLTGAVFVAVMVAALYTGLSFYLFLLIATLGLWEFFKIIHGEGNLTAKIYSTATGVCVYLTIGGVFSGSGLYHLITLKRSHPDTLFYLLPLFLTICLIELFRKHSDTLKNLASATFGWLYIALPFSLAYVIDRETSNPDSADEFYIPFLIIIFILVWCNDVFAYLIGRSLGKTPLIPRISPKKTVEGTLGGFVITILVTWLLKDFLPFRIKYSTVYTVLLGAIIAVMGVLGDLLESKFKREFNIKDSGNILPGHGGILDRFDSFIFIIPWVYLLNELAYSTFMK